MLNVTYMVHEARRRPLTPEA